MKRVLCIVSSLDTGGAETFMMKLFRKFPEGYVMDFIVSTQDGFYEAEVKKLGGIIHRVSLRTEHPIKTFFEIQKVVRKNKYKYVLKLCDTSLAFYDLLAARLGGAKRISVRSCNASANLDKKTEDLCRLFQPLFNHLADVKIAPSKLAAEFTFGKRVIDKNQVFILKNAIDLDVYRYSIKRREKIREELNIEEDTLVIGHIGRFVKQKNHRFLINVYNEIHKRVPNSRLILVGDGEKKQEVTELVEKLKLDASVHFLGIRADIPDLLSSMDVFVLPSLYEGLPNTVIEAQAAGLPCVIADTITQEAKITQIVDYVSLEQNYSKWADAIIQNSKQIRRTYDEEIVNKGFEIKSSVDHFISLIFG